MVRKLLETLTELERNDSVRCLLLTGAPGVCVPV